MDGGIFWPQLKWWFWMGYFLATTKRVAMDEDIFWLQLKDEQS